MIKSRFFLLAIFFLVACDAQDDLQTITLASGDSRIHLNVEIADDSEEQSRGLMHREELCDDCGMLFVFDDEKPRSFWMKNTLIPLDILYFDSSGDFINAHTMEPCRSDPCSYYRSERPAKYALEVNVGAIQVDSWTLVLPE